MHSHLSLLKLVAQHCLNFEDEPLIYAYTSELISKVPAVGRERQTEQHIKLFPPLQLGHFINKHQPTAYYNKVLLLEFNWICIARSGCAIYTNLHKIYVQHKELHCFTPQLLFPPSYKCNYCWISLSAKKKKKKRCLLWILLINSAKNSTL